MISITTKIILMIVGILFIILLVADSIIKHIDKKNGRENKGASFVNKQIRAWLVANMRSDIKKYNITKEDLFNEKEI